MSLKLCLPLSCAFVVLTSGCIFREERPPTLVEMKVSTQYNHRGMVQNGNGVLQPKMRIDAPLKDIGGGDDAAMDRSPEVERSDVDPGIDEDLDPDAGFSESTSISGGAISFQAWGNVDLSNDTDGWFPDVAGGKFSEVRLSTWYSRTFG
ncbi:MAG: hypothetical protein AAF517_17465, partial [Planctomycetota bacterium]